MRSIRGAISAEENTKENILENTKLLLEEIIKENNLNTEDIISILFTCTKDLTKVYPAVAARGLGIVNAALMCCDELYIEGSMNMCIRVMVNADINVKQSEVQHIYLKEAKKLRPDLAK
ncbi:chorismate mutase [Anaeropeptidivorans aminofermentans]|uniref:chorismate mutase n=1 Tax=Anaeropeptidivorans aminofermentans TaxID=2934315 RepID=UPI002B2182EE|nr:chorismate mutase [Anaeropeptidivorans aminofermentans]